MYLYDVNKGRYEDKQSPIHSLDPRVKLYGMIFYALTCVFIKKYILLLIPVGILAVCVFLSGVSILTYLRSLRAVFVMLLGGFVINLIFVPFETAFLLLLRFLMIAFFCMVMIKTTTSRELLRGIKKGFHVSEGTAMTMAIAFMFLPILGSDMNEIRVAQASRGADITVGGLGKRLKNSVSIIKPLFRRTIEKAEKMANAMDVRCYDSTEPRTEVDRLSMDIYDALFIFVVAVGLAVVLLVRFL